VSVAGKVDGRIVDQMKNYLARASKAKNKTSR